MGIRSAALHALAVIITGYTTYGYAQRPSSKTQREIQTATTARAEMTAGALNPEHTRPGDRISIRLIEDVKSNGRTVLGKGTELGAIVRSVVRNSPDDPLPGQPLTMIELQWLTPEAVLPNVTQLMMTLQSFTQVGSSMPSAAPDRPGSVPPLPAEPQQILFSGKSNPALMSMPFIVAADEDTTLVLERDFGFSSEEQMYRTGRGDMLTSGGDRRSVELFSRLANDTVITSTHSTFEITAGAKMQLLIAVRRK